MNSRKPITTQEREQIQKWGEQGSSTKEIAKRTQEESWIGSPRSESSVRSILRSTNSKNKDGRASKKEIHWTVKFTKKIQPSPKPPKTDQFEDAPGQSGTGEIRPVEEFPEKRTMLIIDPRTEPASIFTANGRSPEEAAYWSAAGMQDSPGQERILDIRDEVKNQIIVYYADPETGDMEMKLVPPKTAAAAHAWLAGQMARRKNEDKDS